MMKSPAVRLTCPACSNPSATSFCFAVVSPWVTELASESNPQVLEIRECIKCQTVFSENGHPATVLEALYKDYRGERYQKIRQSWEPGYTSNLNTALNGSAEWMELRQRDILNALSLAGIAVDEIQTCVDFGGGHGGVMPNFPKRFVFEENSQVKDSHALKVIKRWEEVSQLSPDLVMCCGVLEHVNNPIELVELLKTSNARYFYFEVPAGVPPKRFGLLASKRALNSISRSKIAWRLVQRIERRLGREKLRKYFPFRISEHLQFFSEDGLNQLIQNSDMRVMQISTRRHSAGLDGSENLAFEHTIGVVACLRT